MTQVDGTKEEAFHLLGLDLVPGDILSYAPNLKWRDNATPPCFEYVVDGYTRYTSGWVVRVRSMPLNHATVISALDIVLVYRRISW